MRSATNILTKVVIVTVVGGLGLSWNGQIWPDAGSALISSAEARVGRPLTPMSYAGVARRTTRRAVAVGAVGTAAVVVAPMVVAPAAVCGQAVNAYGQIVTVCR